jgi:hypothetical protein
MRMKAFAEKSVGMHVAGLQIVHHYILFLVLLQSASKL